MMHISLSLGAPSSDSPVEDHQHDEGEISGLTQSVGQERPGGQAGATFHAASSSVSLGAAVGSESVSIDMLTQDDDRRDDPCCRCTWPGLFRWFGWAMVAANTWADADPQAMPSALVDMMPILANLGFLCGTVHTMATQWTQADWTDRILMMLNMTANTGLVCASAAELAGVTVPAVAVAKVACLVLLGLAVSSRSGYAAIRYLRQHGHLTPRVLTGLMSGLGIGGTLEGLAVVIALVTGRAISKEAAHAALIGLVASFGVFSVSSDAAMGVCDGLLPSNACTDQALRDAEEGAVGIPVVGEGVGSEADSGVSLHYEAEC